MPTKMDGKRSAERLMTEPRWSRKKRRNAAPRKERLKIGMSEDRPGRRSISDGVQYRRGSFGRNRTTAQIEAKRNRRPVSEGKAQTRIRNDEFQMNKPNRRRADPNEDQRN